MNVSRNTYSDLNGNKKRTHSDLNGNKKRFQNQARSEVPSVCKVQQTRRRAIPLSVPKHQVQQPYVKNIIVTAVEVCSIQGDWRTVRNGGCLLVHENSDKRYSVVHSAVAVQENHRQVTVKTTNTNVVLLTVANR